MFFPFDFLIKKYCIFLKIHLFSRLADFTNHVPPFPSFFFLMLPGGTLLLSPQQQQLLLLKKIKFFEMIHFQQHSKFKYGDKSQQHL